MRPVKNTIKRSFSEAAPTYDRSAAFQREVAEALSARIPALINKGEYACAAPSFAFFNEAPLRLLDIGCGTGYLMERASGIPGLKVFGCDMAQPMLVRASGKTGLEGLAAADCESLPFADEGFDIIASSLAFQWADISASFEEAERVLKPGGLFIFTTLGPETFRELRACYAGKTPLEFHDISYLRDMLVKAGFIDITLECRVIIRRYESLRSLLRTLKEIGAAPSAPCGEGLGGAALIRKAEREYATRFPSPDGGIVASYEVIFASARKG